MLTRHQERTDTTLGDPRDMKGSRICEIYRQHSRNTPTWQREECQTTSREVKCNPPRSLNSIILFGSDKSNESNEETQMLNFSFRGFIDTSMEVIPGSATGNRVERRDGSTKQFHRKHSDQKRIWNDLSCSVKLQDGTSRASVSRRDNELSTAFNPLHGGLNCTWRPSEYQEVNTRPLTAAQRKERRSLLLTAAEDYGYANEVARLRHSQEEYQRRCLLMEWQLLIVEGEGEGRRSLLKVSRLNFIEKCCITESAAR